MSTKTPDPRDLKFRVTMGTVCIMVILGTLFFAWLCNAWVLPLGGLFFVPLLIGVIRDKPAPFFPRFD